MKLWSRGLGKTEVLMDFRYYKTISDPAGDDIFIIGSMQDPDNWEFRITLGPDDVPGLMKVFFSRAMIRFLFWNLHRYVGYLFSRKLFLPAGAGIEEKVNSAYEQVMYGRRPSLRPRR